MATQMATPPGIGKFGVQTLDSAVPDACDSIHGHPLRSQTQCSSLKRLSTIPAPAAAQMHLWEMQHAPATSTPLAVEHSPAMQMRHSPGYPTPHFARIVPSQMW